MGRRTDSRRNIPEDHYREKDSPARRRAESRYHNEEEWYRRDSSGASQRSGRKRQTDRRVRQNTQNIYRGRFANDTPPKGEPYWEYPPDGHSDHREQKNLNYYQRMQRAQQQRENFYRDLYGEPVQRRRAYARQDVHYRRPDGTGLSHRSTYSDPSYPDMDYPEEENDWTPDRKKVRRRKKRRKKKHPLRVILILLVFLLIVLFLIFKGIMGKMERVDPIADTTADDAAEAAGIELYHESGVLNLLLIGQDARSGEEQTRSDSMIIVSLNTKTGKISLVSLMRDLYVPIPGYDSNRLNAAYAYGGMETLDKTIQQDFGIDINGNAVVDFDGFLSALTAVGDLEIELTAEEAAYLNLNPNLGEPTDDGQSTEVWNLTEGVNTLTAKQALAYSRMRYIGNSDWDRVNRQKKLIQAAFSKLKGHPIRLLQTMNAAAPSIKTDMTDGRILKALFYALRCGTDMDTYTIPGDGMYSAQTINGMSVLVADLDACSSALRQYLYGPS